MLSWPTRISPNRSRRRRNRDDRSNFPIARFLLTRIGLPWLSELGRYSELARRRVHEWIDEEYRDEGFDPEQAEAASDALIERLESTTDQSTRAAWQRLAELFAAAEEAE